MWAAWGAARPGCWCWGQAPRRDDAKTSAFLQDSLLCEGREEKTQARSTLATHPICLAVGWGRGSAGTADEEAEQAPCIGNRGGWFKAVGFRDVPDSCRAQDKC